MYRERMSMSTEVASESCGTVREQQDDDDEEEKEKEKVDSDSELEDVVGSAKIKKEYRIRKPKRNKSASVEKTLPDVTTSSSVDRESAAAPRSNGASNGAASDASLPVDAVTTNGVGNDAASLDHASTVVDGAEKRKAEAEEAPSKKMKGQFKNRPVNKSARDPSLKLCNRSAER